MAESSELLVINVPYEDGGGPKSRNGAKYAPEAIKNEILKWPWRQSEDGQEVKFRFIDIPGDGTQILNNFSRVLSKRLERGEKKICVLMGDNSVSFHSAYELWKHEPQFGLFLFDRHPDCMDAVTEEGIEKDPHAYWLAGLIGIGRFNVILDPKRVVLFGIGDGEKKEEEFIKQFKITTYPISELRNSHPSRIKFDLEQFSTIRQWKAIHVVIDVDVMTASEVPATGVRRGGGLSSGQLIDYIKMVKELIKEFKIELEVWNIAEARLDKEKDPGMITIINSASLLYEIAV